MIHVSRRAWALFLVFSLGLAVPAFGQNALSIGDGVGPGLAPDTVPVTLTNSSAVEGFILAVGYDTSLLSVTEVSVAGTVTASAGAELIAPEIFESAGGFTLGVVLDFNAPFGGQVIPAGTDQSVATFTAAGDVTVMTDTVVDIVFMDGVFNTPPLDNIIVQGGLSIGQGQGLTLNNGTFTLQPVTDTLRIESASAPSNSSGAVRILLDNLSGDVQGFEVAIAHDESELDLVDINLNGTITAAQNAEFVVPDTNPIGGDGGTLGVVLDFDPPFDGQVIPSGMGNHIANFVYACDNVITDPDPSLVSSLAFVDGVLGLPPLENLIVIAGQSLTPAQVNGTFTCLPVPAAPDEDTEFSCGILNNQGVVVDPVAAPGEIVPLCFFYQEGTPDPFSGICVGDNIQAFQLALNFDCNLNIFGDSFTLAGTILEAVGAEFVNVSVDNDPNDGDGCELTIGILLDAVPPFAGQSAPATCDPVQIGCIDVQIRDSARCNDCLPIEFRDGVNGAETVPLNNVVVINNLSLEGFNTNNCNICVAPDRLFARGDCNFDDKVDIGDAQASLAQQFRGFAVPCLDACDANDDGKLNVADTVFLLNYLFNSGPIPPAPGPDPVNPGLDPTADDLDCQGGENGCL